MGKIEKILVILEKKKSPYSVSQDQRDKTRSENYLGPIDHVRARKKKTSRIISR